MTITDLKFTTVSIPFREPEIWSGGGRLGITSTIVEVFTDEGITGIGEALPAPTPEVTLAALSNIRALVLGENPFHIERIVNKIYSLGGFYSFVTVANFAIGGVEMALWDIVGKALRVPTHILFGGPLRKEVAYMCFIQRKSPDLMAEEATQAVEKGFRTIYTKVGLDYESDIAVVQAIRKAIGPKPRLRVDANEAWSPGTALRILREMEPYNLEYVEQPIAMRDIDQLRVLRMRTNVPIAANQSSWTNRDLYQVLAMGAADVVMTDPFQAGGLLAFKKAAGIAESAGVPIVYHCVGPLAISTYAAMQVIASSTNFLLDNQTYNHMLSDDVVINVPKFKRGRLGVPETPGIGVELDYDKVARYAELYEKQGYYSAYDTQANSFSRESSKEDNKILWFPYQ
ncbi:MAG: mandelate racemase/muconate lactonizing enzyme family protein [Acidobacteria bacterium]|nr:mandelate racemase/muconate lactonizing enzyme family protein [Acidobacteriota bacterium]MCI0719669.1 mandelate racemase/muconate lactonizing enzyme family protein [Acidobacteriota bacterium]